MRKPMKIAGTTSDRRAFTRSSPSTLSTAASAACQVSALAPTDARLASSASATKPNLASVKTSATTPKLNRCDTATTTATSTAATAIDLSTMRGCGRS